MKYNQYKLFILIQWTGAEAKAPLLLEVREDPGTLAKKNQPHLAIAA